MLYMERRKGGEGNKLEGEVKRISAKVNGAKHKDLVYLANGYIEFLVLLWQYQQQQKTRNSGSSHNFLVQTQK